MTQAIAIAGTPSASGWGLGLGSRGSSQLGRDAARIGNILARAARSGALSKVEGRVLADLISRNALRASPVGRALMLAYAAYELTPWHEMGESEYPLWFNVTPPSSVWEIHPWYAVCPSPPAGATGWGTKQTPYSTLPTGACGVRSSGTNTIDQGSPRVSSGVAYWYTIWSQQASGFKYYWPRVAYRTKTAGYTAVPALPAQDANLNPVTPVTVPASTIGEGSKPAIGHGILSPYNRWRELIAPRPDGKPIRDNGTVAKPAVPVVGPLAPSRGFVVTPRGVKEDPKQRHRPRPPRKREKERKAIAKGRVGKALGYALSIASEATEAIDVIESLYYALPKVWQTARDKSPQEKLRALYFGWHALDIDQALKNILLTEIMDKGIAKATQPLQRELRRYRPDREMPLFGPLV